MESRPPWVAAAPQEYKLKWQRSVEWSRVLLRSIISTREAILAECDRPAGTTTVVDWEGAARNEEFFMGEKTGKECVEWFHIIGTEDQMGYTWEMIDRAVTCLETESRPPWVAAAPQEYIISWFIERDTSVKWSKVLLRSSLLDREAILAECTCLQALPR